MHVCKTIHNYNNYYKTFALSSTRWRLQYPTSKLPTAPNKFFIFCAHPFVVREVCLFRNTLYIIDVHTYKIINIYLSSCLFLTIILIGFVLLLRTNQKMIIKLLPAKCMFLVNCKAHHKFSIFFLCSCTKYYKLVVRFLFWG